MAASDLANMTWGWTSSGLTGTVRAGDPDSISSGNELTDNMSTTHGTADPPPAFFQGVNHVEGKDGNRATRNAFYDSQIYSDYYVGNIIGDGGGIPKIGFTDSNAYIETENLELPLTQNDVFEAFLEFASRDGGNYGGFKLRLTVTIYDRAGSTLYSETKTHSGNMSRWTIWSIPVVSQAGLVVENTDTSSTTDLRY